MTFQIVSGEVEYATPRPFELSSARVKLTFTVEPGADPEPAMAAVGQMARARAEAMVSGAPAAAVPPTTRTRKPAETPPPTGALTTLTAQAVAPPPPTSVIGSTTAQSAQVAQTVVGVSTGAADPRLTDLAIKEACAARVNAVKVAGADTTNIVNGVRALVAKYTGGPGISITTVADLTLRSQFLLELAGLSA